MQLEERWGGLGFIAGFCVSMDESNWKLLLGNPTNRCVTSISGQGGDSGRLKCMRNVELKKPNVT